MGTNRALTSLRSRAEALGENYYIYCTAGARNTSRSSPARWCARHGGRPRRRTCSRTAPRRRRRCCWRCAGCVSSIASRHRGFRPRWPSRRAKSTCKTERFDETFDFEVFWASLPVAEEERVENVAGGERWRPVARRCLGDIATALFTTLFRWGTRIVSPITFYAQDLLEMKQFFIGIFVIYWLV